MLRNLVFAAGYAALALFATAAAAETEFATAAVHPTNKGKDFDTSRASTALPSGNPTHPSDLKSP